MNKILICSVIVCLSLNVNAGGDRPQEPSVSFYVRVPAPSADELETGDDVYYFSQVNPYDYVNINAESIAEQRAIMDDIRAKNNARQDRTHVQQRRDSVRSILKGHILECETLIRTIKYLEQNVTSLRAQQFGTYGNTYLRLEHAINIELKNLSDARSRFDVLRNVIIPNALRADDAELVARARELRAMR
jgi:hypothetical protein